MFNFSYMKNALHGSGGDDAPSQESARGPKPYAYDVAHVDKVRLGGAPI